MKILVVCREIPSHKELFGYAYAQFVHEQVIELRKLGLDVNVFLIKRGGFRGYFGYVKEIKDAVKENSIDIVHVHGGHIGAFVVLQRLAPTIVTYHGSDINVFTNRVLSHVSILFSKLNIFVSNKILSKTVALHSVLLPCGVDTKVFVPIKKEIARKQLNFKQDKKIILFAGNRDRVVKNYSLAQKATDLVDDEIQLIELKGYSRDQVNILLNACDLLLLTSFSEGSPQIIKEAMACNCPIVSTNVGDVKEIITNIPGCYICSYNPTDVAKKINEALHLKKRTIGREKIIRSGLDLENIAKKLLSYYRKILEEKI